MPLPADYTMSLPFLPVNKVSSCHLLCSAMNCTDSFYAVKYRYVYGRPIWRGIAQLGIFLNQRKPHIGFLPLNWQFGMLCRLTNSKLGTAALH